MTWLIRVETGPWWIRIFWVVNGVLTLWSCIFPSSPPSSCFPYLQLCRLDWNSPPPSPSNTILRLSVPPQRQGERESMRPINGFNGMKRRRRRRRDGPTYGELEIITKEGKGDFSLPLLLLSSQIGKIPLWKKWKRCCPRCCLHGEMEGNRFILEWKERKGVFPGRSREWEGVGKSVWYVRSRWRNFALAFHAA